jgi:thiol-disulfide isomerase/thioredoxin
MRTLITTLAVVLALCLALPAQTRAEEAAGAIPDFELMGDIAPESWAYLGITETDAPTLADVEADYVIVEVFNMYCPHCQREAPAVNELYADLLDSELTDRVKLIGVGAGNSQYEVDFFRDKYEVPFPIFTDKDYLVYDLFANPGTPSFYLLKLSGDGPHDALLTNIGPFEEPETFLAKVAERIEMEES